jgi:type II secretory pathway pseudopilin PulG
MAKRPTFRKRQAGQAVIIAIAVLFILAFLAAVFVSLLARNIERTNRSSETLTADFYAQAGIEYANQMLTDSPQGADWRPPLQYKLSAVNPNYVSTLTTDEQQAYNLVSGPLLTIPTNDPDKFWLEQGFTRYNTAGGRFLLRLTYGSSSSDDKSIFDNATGADATDPVNSSSAKYIRIESIGRTGVIIANDPTTFTPQPIRLHAELVAYKPIGLVDYSRFITNKYNRSDIANLGVPSAFDATIQNSIVTPGVYDFQENGSQAFAGQGVAQYPLITTYGIPPASPTVPVSAASGGSLRCNASLRLYGFNAAFLNGTNGDDWEIAGNLILDGYSPTSLATSPSALTVTGTDTTGQTNPAGVLATPSNVSGGNFNTIGGLIRDSSTANDIDGFPRSIKRLNPPSLDTVDPSSGLTRYQELAEQGTSANTTGTYVPDPGPYQLETDASPATVYVDNYNDVQPESANTVTGGYTLRDDWLNRTGPSWEGPFYNPPGATIVFGPIVLPAQNGGQPIADWGFTITRSDAPVGLPAGSPVTWQWKSGSATVQQKTPAPTISFCYGNAPAGYQFDASNPVYFLGADNAPTGTQVAGGTANNDVLIYFAGNVRARGVISPTSAVDPVAASEGAVGGGDYCNGEHNGANLFGVYPHHVTIVSGQIAYVEGSLLKGGLFTGTSYGPGNNYASSSSVSILAETYACVNTTQFLAGASIRTDIADETVDQTNRMIEFNGNTLTQAFDLAAPSVTYPNGISLYLSQGSSTANPSYGAIGFNQTTYNGAGTTVPSQLSGFNISNSSNSNWLTGSSSVLNRAASPLAFTVPATGFAHLEFTFGKDPNSSSDYLLERAAVLPSDVRIEATLFAQNNSFFVIPGPWFNSDTTDTVFDYVGLGTHGTYSRPHPDTTTPPANGVTYDQFPFYGQPIDMKVTIQGSVVENMPADIADQGAWMLKWGWIPKFQGADLGAPAVGTVMTTPHPSLNGMCPGALNSTAVAVNAAAAPNLPVQANLPAIGLNIQYDTEEGTGYSAAQSAFIRLDQYGRPLPYAPALPVSPDLLYSGATAGNSLVQ